METGLLCDWPWRGSISFRGFGYLAEFTLVKTGAGVTDFFDIKKDFQQHGNACPFIAKTPAVVVYLIIEFLLGTWIEYL